MFILGEWITRGNFQRTPSSSTKSEKARKEEKKSSFEDVYRPRRKDERASAKRELYNNPGSFTEGGCNSISEAVVVMKRRGK